MVEAIFGLVGVVVGSILTIAKDSITARIRRQEDGSYSAIRLICILEEYADHCVDVVQDDGTSHGQPAGRTDDGEEYYVAQVRLPAPPDFPDDIAWRSLPNAQMHQILALPNKARTTDRHIDATTEYVAHYPDFWEWFEARQEGYAKLGIEALTLAEKLASKYGITATRADLGSDWDVKGFLRSKLVDIETLRQKRSKTQPVI